MFQSLENASQVEAAIRKVLVVQKELTLRLGFSYALSSPTTNVQTAANGNEALKSLQSTCFDILILELNMPGLDGIGVIETLRNRDDRIPVVLCTAQHLPNAAMRAISLGVVDFLIKPAHPADVRRVVEYVINPPQSPLSQALAAVRNGKLDMAIRMLEIFSRPDSKDSYWLRALTLVRDARSRNDAAEMEGEVRSLFPALAFNSPVVS
jgi:CheY-like chemotaxis protein